MSAPTKTLLDQLAERDQDVRAARERVREVGTAASAAKAEAEQAREALVEAFAAGDEAKAATLTKAKLKAEATAGEPWAERQTGAERAAARVKGERDAWVVENISGLIGELAPEAHAATDAIMAGAQALEAARREWHTVEGRVLGLLRVVSPDAVQQMPQIPTVDSAIKDALRATVEIPAPLPRAQAKRERMQADDHLLLEAGERLGEDSGVSLETKEKFARIVAEQAGAA